MYIDCHTIGWKIHSMQSVVVTHSQPEKEEDVGCPIHWNIDFFYCSLMNQSSILIWNDFADFTAPPYAAGGFIIHLYLPVLVFCSFYFGCDVRLCFMITMETVSRKQSNQRLVYVMFGSTTYEHDYFVHAVLIRRHWLLRIRKGLTNRIIRYIFLKR